MHHITLCVFKYVKPALCAKHDPTTLLEDTTK